MALADIPAAAQSRRLDSWKEIAEYLGRDVRTATRWEAQGMPLHRVPGGKGSSVFGFTSEIDAWLSGNHPERAAEPVVADALPAVSRHRAWIAAAVIVGLAGSAAAIAVARRGGQASEIGSGPLQVRASPTDVSVVDAAGAARVIHRFLGLGVLVKRAPARVADLDADGEAEVLVAVAFYDDRATRGIRHGELLNLSATGTVHWRFGFDDVVDFGDRRIGGPWAISDWQEGPASSPARVAVAAHDFLWWGSMVAILDHNGRRLSAFVNPGWIESLLWLDRDRLAIAGFSNARNEAVVALLDVNRADGQAPGTAGTPFACVTCARTDPLFYATLPRSELNQLTGAQFNRASVARVADHIVVTTVEMHDTTATAMYEFDRELKFVGARYSESYWDWHRKLELEGRVNHSRATCPQKNGPPRIHVWDPAKNTFVSHLQ